MDRMLENTPARTVADFLTGYRHTNDDDKATITSKNTNGISQLRDEYRNQCGLNIDQNAFMDELERLGVKVKRTATRSNGASCVPSRKLEGFLGQSFTTSSRACKAIIHEPVFLVTGDVSKEDDWSGLHGGPTLKKFHP